MNRYGAIAMSHWQEWLPERYANLDDPEEFFDQLGRQVETEIESLHRAMVASEPADLPDAQRPAWRAMARLNAQNQILAELVYLEPEHGNEERPADPASPHQSMVDALNVLYDATDPFAQQDLNQD